MKNAHDSDTASKVIDGRHWHVGGQPDVALCLPERDDPTRVHGAI